MHLYTYYICIYQLFSCSNVRNICFAYIYIKSEFLLQISRYSLQSCFSSVFISILMPFIHDSIRQLPSLSRPAGFGLHDVGPRTRWTPASDMKKMAVFHRAPTAKG